jgi:type I restriction enzyme, S subunit
LKEQWITAGIGDAMVKRAGTVDPSKFPSELFDLYSIPAYDRGAPEVVYGSEVGSSKQTVRSGDVLLSRIVPHIRRAWIVGPDTGRRIIASGEWIVFRSPKFDPRWLRHLLMSDRFHREFMRTVAGVGGSLLRARPGQVSQIKVVVPPLADQAEIAAILERANAIGAKRRQVLAYVDRLSQAIFFDMFGDPIRNEMGWEKVTLGDASLRVTDGEHKTPLRSDAGVPLLSARSIQSGWINFAATDFVPDAEYELLRRRIEPQQGDVLISCSGTIGRVARVRERTRFAMVRSVALVRPSPELSSGFLAEFLSTEPMNRLMNTRANSSAQANLFQNQIKALPIFIPPLDVQKTFEARAHEVSRLRRGVSDALTRSNDLSLALQSRAFSGQREDFPGC